jgi:hypothetical protein
VQKVFSSVASKKSKQTCIAFVCEAFGWCWIHDLNGED